jgi:hypothetical protein
LRYIQTVNAANPANCPLAETKDAAVSVTRTIYQELRAEGTGFWLPGRQPIAFAPWEYTPLDKTLYEAQPRFAVNFDDEKMLEIPAIRGGTDFSPGRTYDVDRDGHLSLGDDGRLCFRGAHDWCTRKGGKGARATFTIDGELLQTDANGLILWRSWTAGRGITLGSKQGKLCIFDGVRNIIWSP